MIFLYLYFFRGVTGGRGGWGDLTSLSFFTIRIFTIIIAPLSYRHYFCSGEKHLSSREQVEMVQPWIWHRLTIQCRLGDC